MLGRSPAHSTSVRLPQGRLPQRRLPQRRLPQVRLPQDRLPHFIETRLRCRRLTYALAMALTLVSVPLAAGPGAGSRVEILTTEISKNPQDQQLYLRRALAGQTAASLTRPWPMSIPLNTWATRYKPRWCGASCFIDKAS